MKDYVSKTISKLNNLINKHPNADLRISNKAISLCKILESDIKYDSEINTIYIGY